MIMNLCWSGCMASCLYALFMSLLPVIICKPRLRREPKMARALLVVMAAAAADVVWIVSDASKVSLWPFEPSSIHLYTPFCNTANLTSPAKNQHQTAHLNPLLSSSQTKGPNLVPGLIYPIWLWPFRVEGGFWMLVYLKYYD